MKKINYIHRGKLESRVLEIDFEIKKFITPAYFPSISSAAIRMQTLPLIRFCIGKKYPRLLISAFDLSDAENELKELVKILKEYTKNNVLFVDSGTFESYWLKDKKWNFDRYKKIIKEIPVDIYTSFDEIPKPDDNITKISSNVKKFMESSSAISKQNHCAVVLHGNTPSQLIRIVEDNAKQEEEPSMYAIPERECGITIKDKIKTIKKIRITLNKKNPANILHILGCGNPLSMTIFTFAGADSFDSVDWARWTIDPNTLQFMDLNHIELIDCKCEICKRKSLDVITKALLHNLLFYQNFTQKLQTAILNDIDLKILNQFVDQKTFSKIVKFF